MISEGNYRARVLSQPSNNHRRRHATHIGHRQSLSSSSGLVAFGSKSAPAELAARCGFPSLFEEVEKRAKQTNRRYKFRENDDNRLFSRQIMNIYVSVADGGGGALSLLCRLKIGGFKIRTLSATG